MRSRSTLGKPKPAASPTDPIKAMADFLQQQRIPVKHEERLSDVNWTHYFQKAAAVDEPLPRPKPKLKTRAEPAAPAAPRPHRAEGPPLVELAPGRIRVVDLSNPGEVAAVLDRGWTRL